MADGAGSGRANQRRRGDSGWCPWRSRRRPCAFAKLADDLVLGDEPGRQCFNSEAQLTTTMICAGTAGWSGSRTRSRWPSPEAAYGEMTAAVCGSVNRGFGCPDSIFGEVWISTLWSTKA